MVDDEGAGPSAIASACNRSPPDPRAADREELRVAPNKNRIVQVRRAGKRRLFDRRRKEVFLEWFAATCNLVLSAGKAGVCPQTVYKHLLKDEAFHEACGRALQLGYFRLEARGLQEAYTPPGTPSFGGPPPEGKLGEEYEVRILDEAAAEEHFDRDLALQLLREDRRHLPAGSAGPVQRARKNIETGARSATNAEVAEALARRLKSFALRQEKSSPTKARS